jgi:hypothetical protein
LPRVPAASPETPLWERAIAGGIGGLLAALAGVQIWNSIAVPGWLLTQTTAPLAKAALGLGLIFNGLALALLSIWLLATPTLSGPGRQIMEIFLLLGSLGLFLGPILCLETAPRTRSGGVLLWAVSLTVTGLVIGSNPGLRMIRFGDRTILNLSGLVAFCALPLILVFFRRLAASLDLRKLVSRARSMLRSFAWCLASIGSAVVGFYLTSIVGDTGLVSEIAVVLQATGTFMTWVLVILIVIDFYRLTRSLQAEILERL